VLVVLVVLVVVQSMLAIHSGLVVLAAIVLSTLAIELLQPLQLY
jgi:hypothetical protein